MKSSKTDKISVMQRMFPNRTSLEAYHRALEQALPIQIKQASRTEEKMLGVKWIIKKVGSK